MRILYSFTLFLDLLLTGDLLCFLLTIVDFLGGFNDNFGLRYTRSVPADVAYF